MGTLELLAERIPILLDKIDGLFKTVEELKKEKNLQPLTREGAMKYLNCSESTITYMMKQGKLKAYYLQSSPRFKVEDLNQILTERKTKP
jgi:excisionase family DNA binding protein